VNGPSLEEVQRSEKVILADGKLYVHGIPIALRSHVLEFLYTEHWHCRLVIDSCGAQGLVCGWQRMVHEPSYEAVPYGGYGSHASYSPPGYASASLAQGASLDSAHSAYGYGAGLTEQVGGEPVSRAFVNLVGMSEYGALRFVCLSKIQRVSLSLHAFELDKAPVVLHFQAGRTFSEIVYIRDGAER
jgi:hypothetical protein